MTRIISHCTARTCVVAACVIQDSQLGSIRLTIDTIDYVNGIGNTPMHSIENLLFQRGTTLSSCFCQVYSHFHFLLSWALVLTLLYSVFGASKMPKAA